MPSQWRQVLLIAFSVLVVACAGRGNTSASASPSPKPDAYANCLQNGFSKKNCVAIAKIFGQTPPPQDRNMTPAPTQTPDTLEPPPSADDSTPVPAATPNYHNERAKDQGYWNASIIYIAQMQVYLDAAIAAVAQSSDVTASAYLAQGEKAASEAVTAVQTNVPDGWDDVSNDLATAAQEFQQGLTLIRSYLDDNKPSEAADAQQHAQNARDAFASAEHEAHVHYLQLNGSVADLMTMDQAVKGEESVIQAFSSKIDDNQ